MYLEIQKRKNSHVGFIRSSYRQNGKVKHKQHGSIQGKTLAELKIIQAVLRGETLTSDKVEILQSKEYGASAAVFKLAKALQLDKTIYSRTSEQWVQDALAMMAGRLIYAGSKLGLTRRTKDSALWELAGLDDSVQVVENCYEVMDRLLERQPSIQKTLAKKHLAEGTLVLYDITSSYMEGAYTDSEIVAYGYNRDQKRGHEQMVIGLLCDAEGCPVGVEVFAGNTPDAKTVPDKIAEVQGVYGVRNIIFVGDRGMITQTNFHKVKDREGLQLISALTHRQIVELLSKKTIQIDLFDEREIVEVVDPEDSSKRYCLCLNPSMTQKEHKTRQSLLDKTSQKLDKIAKGKGTPERLSARVGKVLAQTKMGKFVRWTITNKRLEWSLDQPKIDAEALLDGCYVIMTTVPQAAMNKEEVVASYKKLRLVEDAFRMLKTVQLEIRPVYHRTDDRIRAHVFICMLAYYLEWHMKQRLGELFKQDGKGAKRRWTFELVIERLKSIRRETVKQGDYSYKVITSPDEEQKRILQLLNIEV